MGSTPWSCTVVRHGAVVALFLCIVAFLHHSGSPSTLLTRIRAVGATSGAVEPTALSGAPVEWDESPVYEDIESSECSIERVPYNILTPEMFFEFYEEQRPVILSYPVDSDQRRNRAFEEAVRKHHLLAQHGSEEITLSTGNRNSYEKRQVTVAEYIHDYVRPQLEEVSGNASWYHFGDPHHRAWVEVNSLYEPPLKFIRPVRQPALSFGFAGSGTGVPFHTHGAVFAEVLHGRKRWWIAEPSHEPRYDPDDNTLHWLRHVRRTLSAAEASKLYECVCARGDILYIPSHWHHATLNVGESVFMSVFL